VEEEEEQAREEEEEEEESKHVFGLTLGRFDSFNRQAVCLRSTEQTLFFCVFRFA
jgi:hypothetical protein